MKTALSIAGSDCSGGAGIQADLKTMTLCGVYAMSVITALTAQNTTGVRSIAPVTPEFLAEQLDAVFTDIPPDAVKIGMVSSAAQMQVIVQKLRQHHAINIVVDPVMLASSGDRLMQEETLAILTDALLPIAALVTPNIPEAEQLSGMVIQNEQDMLRAAQMLCDRYHCAVLLKGGHSCNQTANDLLCQPGNSVRWFCGSRIHNPNTHGTGCTLSSAITAYLAKGVPLEQAVSQAKTYLSGAIAAMLDLGKGSGPLDHAFFLNHPSQS